MINFVTPTDKCWWCGAVADSAEHRIKKSDIISQFGKGPYQKDDQVVVGNSTGLRKINGPKSKEIKFRKNLCQNCNNNVSQEFDLSYQYFTEYLINNENHILETNELNWSHIYGDQWQHKKENLLRYYVKHVCCRLSDHNIKISSKVKSYLNNKSCIENIQFYPEIRLDIVAYLIKIRKALLDDGCLWTGPLYYEYNANKTEFYDANSFLGFRWFRMYWRYDSTIGPSRPIDNTQESWTLSCNSICDPQEIIDAENLDTYIEELTKR